jgi:hypothetical protein
MISFLNDKYAKVSKKKFLTIGSLLCFISDVGNIAYINLYALQKYITDQSIANALALQGVNLRQISAHDFDAYKQLMIDAMGLVFAGFLAYHIIVYFFFARDKKWAKKYVYGYALTGTILTAVELVFLFQEHFMWAIVMLLTTFIYIYTLFGIRYFKKQEQ